VKFSKREIALFLVIDFCVTAIAFVLIVAKG